MSLENIKKFFFHWSKNFSRRKKIFESRDDLHSSDSNAAGEQLFNLRYKSHPFGDSSALTLSNLKLQQSLSDFSTLIVSVDAKLAL